MSGIGLLGGRFLPTRDCYAPRASVLIVDRGWSQADYRQRVGAIAQAALLVTANPEVD